ncbi:MAG: flavin reductase family protein [Bacteroidota bacterium]
MSDFLSIDPMSLSVGKRHAYLLTAVAPRPIAFASTIDQAGNVNLSPFSFFNVFSSNPPVMIFSPARRGRDNTTKHTYENIREVRETVISIVNRPMVEQMSLASTEYDKGVNEFVKAGFTQVASEMVKPPRVGESPASFECVVDDIIELGQEGGAGILIIARVVRMHFRKEFLTEDDQLDTRKLDLVGRMGSIWYTHANGEALFEVPKPGRTKGIGFDRLPKHIRESYILSGNNLARLAGLAALPKAEEIASIRKEEAVRRVLQNSPDPTLIQENLERTAKKYLENGDVLKAFSILMLQENTH